MKKFKTFFYKLVILLAIFISVDLVFGFVFRRVFKLQERGKYFITSYAIDKSKEDIVIFGNSHAAQHFNATRMMDSLGSGTFNFGSQSQSILFYYPLLESVLMHHNPKLVILNLDPGELVFDKAAYDKLNAFLPYYKENPYIDSAILLADKLDQFKAVSNFYRFNSTVGYVFLNIFSKSYEKSALSHGFDPQYGSLCKLNMNDMFQEEKGKAETRIDELKVRFLNQVIADLKSRNINLFVTFAPVYKGKIKNAPAYQKLVSILDSNHVEYSNYYLDKRFSDDCALFHDQNHLNLTGANLFTDDIVKEIKERQLLSPGTSPGQSLSKR